MADELHETYSQPIGDETPQQRYARLYEEKQTGTATATSSGTTPPITYSVPPEFTEALQTLQADVSQLKQHATSTATATATMSPAAHSSWVQKIRDGDFAGAQAVIVEDARRSFQADLDTRLNQTRQQAYQDAIAANQVQLEMDRHIQKFRQENPDLIQFERYLEAPVAQRIQLARDAGKVKTPADLIREYKVGVDHEVAELRKLGLQLRAAGKDEATTRIREVTTSGVMSPQQLQSQTGDQQQPNLTGEDTDSYFARRSAEGRRRRGLE